MRKHSDVAPVSNDTGVSQRSNLVVGTPEKSVPARSARNAIAKKLPMLQIPRTTNEPIAPTAIHITTGRRNSRPPIQTVATMTGIAPAINLAGTPS